MMLKESVSYRDSDYLHGIFQKMRTIIGVYMGRRGENQCA